MDNQSWTVSEGVEIRGCGGPLGVGLEGKDRNSMKTLAPQVKEGAQTCKRKGVQFTPAGTGVT